MNKNRLHKKFKENNRNPRRGPPNTEITTINTYNYLEHTKGLLKKFSVKKHLKKYATTCLKSAKVKYSGCDSLNGILVFYSTQKVKGKITAHSSMLLW